MLQQRHQDEAAIQQLQQEIDRFEAERETLLNDYDQIEEKFREHEVRIGASFQ